MVSYIVASIMALIIYILIFAHIFVQYRKHRSLYGVVTLNSFAERYFSFLNISKLRSYKRTKRMIENTGWKLKVESYYFIKVSMALFMTIFFALVSTSNLDLKYNQIVGDVNFKRTIIEEKLDRNNKDLQLMEINNYHILKQHFNKRTLLNMDRASGISSIESVIVENNMTLPGDDSAIQARRMYEKLRTLYLAEDSAVSPISLFIVFALSYQLLDIFSWLRRKLIYDSADWEIIRLASTAKIFASLPPYSLGSISSNMLRDSNIFKSKIEEFDLMVQSSSPDEDFTSFLEDIKNDDLFRLLDLVYSARRYGSSTIAPSLERFRINKTESVEIKNQRRAGTKALIALFPVIAVSVLAMLYFSYGSFYLTSTIF